MSTDMMKILKFHLSQPVEIGECLLYAVFVGAVKNENEVIKAKNGNAKKRKEKKAKEGMG